MHQQQLQLANQNPLRQEHVQVELRNNKKLTIF